MIVVLCEFGGDVILGKAREIADSIGDKVLALIEAESKDPQRLIYLGADEVLRVDVESPSEWIEVISHLLQSEKQVKILIFPSNIIPNLIAGAVYSREMKNVGCFLDEADHLEGATVGKAFDGNDFMIQKNFDDNRLNIVCLKTSSVTPPFEDASRYGKVREYRLNESAPLSFLLEDVQEETLSSSAELTLIAGDDRVAGFAGILAKKYHARFMKYSGNIEIVYGPCIAIELYEKLRYLPEFSGDLISLNSKSSPINAISEIAIVNPDINMILERLLNKFVEPLENKIS